MKKNIFILLVGLLSCQLTVFAQEPSVKTIYVEIKSDTTIVVRDLFGADCKLYGDIISQESDKKKQLISKNREVSETRQYAKYGGDEDERFYARMKDANDNEEYKKYVSRNEKGIVINLLYNEFPDTKLDLKFFGVLYDSVLTKKVDSQNSPYWVSNEWYRDKKNIYCISIIKGKPEPKPEPKPDPDPKPDPVPDPKPDPELELANLIESIIILIVTCLFIALWRCINKLNKRINSFINTQKQSPQKSEDVNIEKIKKDVISKITSDELVQKISNEDIYNLIMKSEIQLYIQTIIAGKIDEYLRNNKIANPVPTGISGGSNQQPPVVQPELRTTKVEYRADNNCFVISENTQNKIFEIYSINGEYYYTIVNDSSIRKEMLGFITAFSGYVETRQASPIPSTVEVIRDGRLIKNGDMYIVDTNYILQVSLM